jgi:hypothetical protein
VSKVDAAEFKIHSDSDSEGEGWKVVGKSRSARSVRVREGSSSFGVSNSDGEVPDVNPKKLWVKGNPRKLNGDVLKKQGELVIEAVNQTLGEDERKFEKGKNPVVYGFDLTAAASLVFEDEDEAKRFYVSSRGVSVEHQDGVKGKYSLRVNKDTAFDVRLRNQVYWHLKDETTKILKGLPKWIELGDDTVQVRDTGNRGSVFIDAGGELYEVFHVNVSKKRKDHEVIRPVYDNLDVWGMGEKEADILVNKVIKLATLFGRRI